MYIKHLDHIPALILLLQEHSLGYIQHLDHITMEFAWYIYFIIECDFIALVGIFSSCHIKYWVYSTDLSSFKNTSRSRLENDSKNSAVHSILVEILCVLEVLTPWICCILGDPEVTVNLYCVSVLGRLRDLQYIFAVTSGSPSRQDSL